MSDKGVMKVNLEQRFGSYEVWVYRIYPVCKNRIYKIPKEKWGSNFAKVRLQRAFALFNAIARRDGVRQ